MRVLIDVTAERRGGHDRGIGRYLSALRAANVELGNDVEQLHCTIGAGRLAEISALPHRIRSLRRHEYDVFHAPTAYYAATDVRRRARVTTILDMIPLELAAHRRTGLKAKFFHTLAGRSDAVLTLSNHAASRIQALLGLDPRRIVVAPLPPAHVFVPTGPLASGLTIPYVAMMVDVRTPDPRKRAHWIPTLAGQLQSHGITVVVVGGGTDALGVPGVVGLGHVDDSAWASVLRGAEAFVYTSAYEGQGLPPLEAIACGTPVIGMSNTAIPEVVGDAGFLLQEHHDDDDATLLAAETQRIVRDRELRAELARACAGQSAQFTADRFAQQIGNAYSVAVARRS